MSFSSKFSIQNIALALALLLGLHSLWILAAELIRPGFAVVSAFPSPIPFQQINSDRRNANIAATIGLIRGDLWSERVLIDANNIIGDQASLSDDDAKAARAAAQRALAFRPIDSRVWLLLAALSSNRTEQNDRANQLLKMSYYTGPNDKAVIGYRLNLVIDSRALDDAELREAVRREIRTILLRAPELRSSIVTAYRRAQPKDREIILATVAAIDPNFVATLRATQSQ